MLVFQAVSTSFLLAIVVLALAVYIDSAKGLAAYWYYQLVFTATLICQLYESYLILSIAISIAVGIVSLRFYLDETRNGTKKNKTA